MKLLAKLSAKSIGINVQLGIAKNAKGKDVACALDNPHNQHLMRVTGIASSIKTGVSSFGEWVCFMGQHEAIVVETGEIFRSGKLFLPPIASNLLQGAVANSTAVEYAFDIGVTPAPESAVGYEWTVTPILEVSESDPIALLHAKLKDVPALPAPTKIAVIQTQEQKPADDATQGSAAPETGSDTANTTSAPASGKAKSRK